MGSCLKQRGQRVKPSSCFSHAGLRSLWLPGEVSVSVCFIIFCWELPKAVVALTVPDLAVLPALPPVLCLSVTSLLLSHLALAPLLGAVLLPPSRGRWLKLSPTKGGSTCRPSSSYSPTPRSTLLLLPQPCRSPEPSTSLCSSQTLQKNYLAKKKSDYFSAMLHYGGGGTAWQWGSGIMAVSWLRLLRYCNTSAALALQGVFSCDILLVLYAECCRRSVPMCNVV